MIHLYHTDDTEAVLEVRHHAALVTCDFVPESFWATEREDIRAKYLPVAQTWVYEDQGVVVGFISLLDSRIGGLFVTPSHQKKGIGTSFIEHVKTLHTSLLLDVFQQNTLACRFYEKCGSSSWQKLFTRPWAAPSS